MSEQNQKERPKRNCRLTDITPLSRTALTPPLDPASQVFFRAGVLGQLEEIRDDRLAKIISWLQSWIRGYTSRKTYKRLQEQRVALIVVQRNLRKYLQLRTWAWYRLWQKVKPLLNVTRVEDEIRALEEKAAKAEENYERESKLRKELEVANLALLEEKNNLMVALESTKGNVSEYLDKQAKLQSQKADLEAQLNVSIGQRDPFQYAN